MGKKSALISIVLTLALAGAYFSLVVVGNEVEERKYVYSSPLDYALDYLSDEPYSRLEIEVDWVQGYAPSHSALDFLIHKIYTYTDKKYVRVDGNASDEIPLNSPIYTLQDLHTLEDRYRSDYKHGNTAVLYILYLNGIFSDTGGIEEGEGEQTDIAGLEYGFSSIAIFKQEIEEYSQSAYQAEYMERTVLLHEFGHTICLVGIGYDSPQEDPEHPHHSIHKYAVMYYEMDASQGIPPQDFCNDSKKDIQTIKAHTRQVSPIIYVPWMLLLADILSAASIVAAIMEKDSQYQNSSIPPGGHEDGSVEVEDDDMYF